MRIVNSLLKKTSVPDIHESIKLHIQNEAYVTTKLDGPDK